MINKVLSTIFGTKYERELKRLQPTIDRINGLEPDFEALSDGELRAKTDEFRSRLENGEGLEDLLPEAFATVREAAKRTLGMRHYDVQLFGGIILHQGRIAEMKTGEGKTLAATLPVYLNALPAKGVHVVTVNDYLAGRDAEWMGAIYKYLGMSVGTIRSSMPPNARKQEYDADITYGTNNEFGFDYLRDHMKFSVENMVQRGHHYAIVDEVDSILVDEARTPLIISGPSEESTDKYYKVNGIIPRFVRGEEHEEEGQKWTTGDFIVDEKAHSVTLTDEGVAKAEKLLGLDNLYEMENMDWLHAVNQGLRAHHLYKKDVAYLVKDGQVVIVDEFTGRTMPGRRWSDGLHQAVEAKEGVKIERENQTLATITFQNYFRMYDKLAGMTGTAETEEAEFGEIYDLDVSVIPTNKPIARIDYADLIFRTEKEKWLAVVDEIRDCQDRGQPVLVGTISIENSEMLSKMLKKRGVRHVVLNAKFHDKEASIVAQAGRLGSVTIATNMAGRGTDIVLGGNPDGLAESEVNPESDPEKFQVLLQKYTEQCSDEKIRVKEAGGLHILGTERHESRRIDNQLRGRSGRQGDPGSSRFFISLDDDLMRIFGDGTGRVQKLMGTLGMQEGEAIEHRMVTKAIERAQNAVEARNFEVRKRLLEYDDVMNKQREAVYALRTELLEGEESRATVTRVSEDVVDYAVANNCPEEADPRDWNLSELRNDVLHYFDIDLGRDSDLNLEDLGIQELREEIWSRIRGKYEEKEERHGDEMMRRTEREVMLSLLDDTWKDHLLALDHLKEGINLRGYGQRDPLQEYKKESFELFSELKNRWEDTVIQRMFRVEPISVEEYEKRKREMVERMRQRFQLSAPAKTTQARPQTFERKLPKVGRNDPCPCGSGKKYKKCCGAPQRRTA
ncbi:MAG: preprotein translocase subunit SecA [Thermoanaerobaculia bacterium]|nr:preprotein translocase subunit SecA [Thermoanaerobaculia bacterium]